jgi:flagellar motility protein MotE (MotC chaperone)
MVDEKSKKSMKEKVVGLDEATPAAKSTFGKLKKFLLPAAIGIGSMLAMMAIYILVSGDNPNSQNISQTETTETTHQSARAENPDISGTQHKENNETHANGNIREVIKKGNKKDTVKIPEENKETFAIDTAAIMKDLDYLFATPEQETAVDGMTPQDSVDTLNWIQREMAKLNKKIAEAEKKQTELEALENRVNESLVKVDQAESARLVSLARLYDGMKPDEVGKLFANLSDDLIIELLPRMKPANASKILALLPPKRAAKISTSMITVLEDK